MSNTTIKIKEQKINDKFCNIKTEDGQEISIVIASNPKTMALIQAGATEVEVNLVDKNGKKYAWDTQARTSGGGGNFKKETPEEKEARLKREEGIQRMIVAQTCLKASAEFHSERTGSGDEAVLATADKYYQWILKTSI